MLSSSSCHHDTIFLAHSSHAADVGYKRPTLQQRLAATTTSNAVAKKLQAAHADEDCEGASFPAPLVLPEDELSWDPKHPPQSLRSWVREKERNAVTEDRKTIYVAPPPTIAGEVGFMQAWAVATYAEGDNKIALPHFEDLLSYLEAFYYPLPVKCLPPSESLTFASWDTKSKVKKNLNVPYIALNSGTESTRIRVRSTPSFPFTHQLNLDDILDHAIEIIPADAYALLLITENDLYEGDDDDFCCGRAYGGSRIAVVSMARYNPSLQAVGEHEWPASHCEAFVEGTCNPVDKPKAMKRAKAVVASRKTVKGPMHEAIQAFISAPFGSAQDVWFARVARTASHELGHCFALDHCVYYACVMQGTAGLEEDMRQPPYLCPVCESKVGTAVRSVQPEADLEARYTAMLHFCERWEGGMFVALRAWTQARLEEITKNSAE